MPSPKLGGYDNMGAHKWVSHVIISPFFGVTLSYLYIPKSYLSIFGLNT